MNQPMGQWNPPPPPPLPGGAAPNRMSGRKIWIGIGFAMAGHLLTVLIPLVLALVAAPSTTNDYGGDQIGWFLVGAFIGQAILFVAALAFGITLAVKQDGGVGVGILIGWAVGLIISPIVGFGMCVALLSGGLG